MSDDTVLETSINNNAPGHAAKHNATNTQVNYLTEQWAGRATDPTLLASYVAKKGRLVDIEEPFVIAHRGAGANIAPEHTMESYDAAITAGCEAIELDCWRLDDGAIGIMHDSTVDRTTTGTGSVDIHSAMSWKNLTVDAGSSFLTGWPNLKAPLFSEVAGRYGGKVLLVPEAKNVSGQEITDQILKFGIQDSVLVQSFYSAQLVAPAAAGIACMHLTDTPDAPTLLAAGVAYAGISTSASDATITAAVAAGLKVVVYNVDRHVDRDRYLALGVSGFFSDDPIYLRGVSYRRQLALGDPFQSQTWWHGHLASSAANRGVFVAPDEWGYSVTTASYIGAYQGWASPIKGLPAADSFTIDFSFRWNSAAASTSQMLVGVMTNDGRYSDGLVSVTGCNGYTFGIRKNGELRTYRVLNGTTTAAINTTAGTAIADGAVTTHRITVTPTQIRWQRLDVATDTGLISDSTYRGGYLHLGRNGVSGSWKDFVIA